MKIKLFRIFNLLRPQFLFLFVVAIILTAIFSSIGKFNIVIAIFIVLFLGMFLYPKTLEINENVYIYSECVLEPRPKISFVRKTRSFVKAHFKVTEVKNLEFHQNFIEKLFDVGHISFEGETAFAIYKIDLENVELVNNNHLIYGIPNFKEFTLKMKGIIK